MSSSDAHDSRTLRRQHRRASLAAAGRAVVFGIFYPPVAATLALFISAYAIQLLTGAVSNPPGPDPSVSVFALCVLFSGILGAPLGIGCALLGLWAHRVWSRSLDAERLRRRLVTLGTWLGVASAVPIIAVFELDETGPGVFLYASLGALVGALGGRLLPGALGPLPPASQSRGGGAIATRPHDPEAHEGPRTRFTDPGVVSTPHAVTGLGRAARSDGVSHPWTQSRPDSR